MQDRNRGGGQLKGVAVSARHQRLASSALLLSDRRRQEVVGLVAWSLRVGETAGGDEIRQELQLLDQLGVVFPPALIGRVEALAERRSIERVPADQNGSGLLVLAAGRVCQVMTPPVIT
jgi:hypothetical protein